MAISLTKNGNAIVFAFDDNDHYLNDGTIEVPVNSLTLVTDESDMFTFKKAASDDIFISGLYSEIGMSKAELIAWYKDNMVGSTGGGGVTSGEVQTMIDESISGLAESSAVTEEISEAVSGKADTSAVTASINAVSGAIPTQYVKEARFDMDEGKQRWYVFQKEGQNSFNIYNFSINGRMPLSKQNGTYSGVDNFSLVETSAVTSAITSSSTNSQVAGAKAVYDAIGDKADTTAVTASINAAVSGKMDTDSFDSFYNSDYAYYKQETNEAIEGLNSAVSGKVNTTDFNTYSASTDARLSEDEEVTSAALNEVNDALDDKADTTAVTASIAAAVSGKQDTLIAGSGITIDSANTISCTVEGGGKAISGGTNISVTTGATADTINCTLPISKPVGYQSIAVGGQSSVSGDRNIVCGQGSNVVAKSSSYSVPDNAIAVGYYVNAYSRGEASFGQYNDSKINTLVGGASATTCFSVGNGTAENARHNAFEIRRNGDIYITSGGTDIKLQDNLGGSGGLPESAFTAYTAATEARLAEDEEVTAAALNTLNTALGGLKLVSLTQAQYDALANKDGSTLYIVTSSN